MVSTESLDLVAGLDWLSTANVDSIERGQRLRLISPSQETGFRPTGDGRFYNPNIAGLKGGGSWVSSAALDGRQLQNTTVDNVTDTIQCILEGETHFDLAQRVNRLARFKTLSKEFAATYWQVIYPVYVDWFPTGSRFHQYALIYNIDIAITFDPIEPSAEVTITFEREPYWRIGVPPGASPRFWAFLRRGLEPDNGFSYGDGSMAWFTSYSAWKAAVVNNKHEWDGTLGNPGNALSKAYIEIDENEVPGDAPALLCATVTLKEDISVSIDDMPYDLYLWRSSKDHLIEISGDDFESDYYLNTGDATHTTSGGVTMTKPSVTSAQGVHSNGSNVNYYTSNFSITAGGTLDWAVSWDSGVSFIVQYFQRGRFIVLARAAVTAGAAASDIQARLTLNFNSLPRRSTGAVTTGLLQGDWTYLPVNGNYQYKFVYLGDFNIPAQDRSAVTTEGIGIGGITYPVFVELGLRNNSGSTTRSGQILDLLFIPYDEYQGHVITNPTSIATADESPIVLDNSGYYKRGSRENIVHNDNWLFELRGEVPVLEPQVKQRIYIAASQKPSGGLLGLSTPDIEYQLMLDIVPRCYWVNDVEPVE